MGGSVFVAGYPRSGTTLLYRILALSPQFAAVRDEKDSAHETAISVYMNPLLDLAAVYRQVWPDWASVITEADRFDEFAARVGSPGPARRRFENLLTRFVFRDSAFLRSPLDVDSLAVRGPRDPAARLALRAAAMRVSGRRDVVRGFLDLYAQQAAAPRVLEKYPFTYYHFAELAAALPDARFVFVVRDPRDVFASMVRRARVELRDRIPIGRVAWMILSADVFAGDWSNALGAARAFARHAPDRILVLRYEDLTGAPDAAIARLAAFVGVPAAEICPPTEGQEPDPDRRFPLASARPVENTGRLRAELADADLATIARECAAAMAELDYED